MSVIENLKSLKPKVSEKRLITELGLVRELIAEHGILVYHCSGHNNPSNALTKQMPITDAKGRLDPLEKILRENKYDNKSMQDVTTLFTDVYDSIDNFIYVVETYLC